MVVWPDGKRFAFAITDDTDKSVLDRIKPVYDILLENGVVPTKTVWPLDAEGKPITGGESLQCRHYADWVRQLADQGLEIAIHGVADESSTRERVQLGFRHFREMLGRDPRMHINHVGQKDSIYWGQDRFDRPLRWLYRAYRRTRTECASMGHVPTSPYFWGDLCAERITYVRNFTWHDINTLKADPLMPYTDPTRPFVRYWFSGTHASGVDAFCRILSEANLDRLMQEGGACILYTHLGSSFYPVAAEFKRLVKRLGGLPGWFTSASTILDWIGSQRGFRSTADHWTTYQSMQWRWMADQARRVV